MDILRSHQIFNLLEFSISNEATNPHFNIASKETGIQEPINAKPRKLPDLPRSGDYIIPDEVQKKARTLKNNGFDQ